MKRFLSNWELKVLAVMAAVIFWFLVVGAENTFYTYPEEVPIKAFNLSEEYVVANELGGVKLRLKLENRDIIKNLVKDDFNAYVDLEGLSEGEREVEVNVSSKRPEVSVLKVEPSSVAVKIEEMAEKEVPVEHKIFGDLKEGFEVKNVDINLENAVIKGPQKLLNTLDTAYVNIELDGEDKDINSVYPVQVLDNQDEAVPNVKIEPGEVEVKVEISPTEGRKLIGVQPNITGTPQGNSWVKSVTAEPSFVVLKGDPETLQEIEFIKTEEIDVSELKESSEFNVGLSGLSEDISVEDDGEITVNIQIEKLESNGQDELKEKTFDVPVAISKFRDDQNERIVDPPAVTIVAEGRESNLNKLSSSGTVELDISGYKKENQVTLQIDKSNFNLPEGVNIVSVTPSEVTVSW